MVRICTPVGALRETEKAGTHLVNALQSRTKPSMNAEHPSIHDRAKRKVVKDLATPSPDVTAPVLSLAFVIKPVHLRDLSRLMVAAYEGHAFGVADFEGEKEEEGFDAVEPAIHKVA